MVFSYRGLDGEQRLATLEFVPAPDRLAADHAAFEQRLEPGGRASMFLTVICDRRPDPPPRPERFFVGLRDARRALRATSSRAAALTTSSEIFNEIVGRSVADLAMLMTETTQGPYPYAGIPWFSTAFGRDGIITAMQLLWLDPTIARGVLSFLAARQATGFSAEADAEPGKILHETRHGEMARLGEIPFGLYYGSVDSTPLFVMLAGMYFERTGDLETIRTLWPNLEAALAWIDQHGDRDDDGLVEYRARSERGLSNQGWKDSEDSIFHADGRLAEGAIALAEVQGYVYAAKRAAAALALALGDQDRSADLDAQAERLRQQFEAAFWCPDLGTYALALDGDKRPCRVRTSNAGQVLFSGIAAPDRAAQVADLLLEPAFFSGWGIRTLAACEVRFNPMSYHNGSVWPHDNALIARGFARYGLRAPTLRVFSGLFDAAAYMDLRRLPELFCGFRRLQGAGPTSYPVACSPQAWASTTPFALLEACLGLEFDPTLQEIRFRQPRLPEFLNEVIIRKLTLGDSRFDVMLRRYGNEVSVNLLDRQGDGRVAVSL